MRQTLFMSRASAAVLAAVLTTSLFSSLSAAAGENRVYMMTALTEVSGTRDIEAGAADRGILRSLTAINSASADRRAAAYANLCIGYALQGKYDEALA